MAAVAFAAAGEVAAAEAEEGIGWKRKPTRSAISRTTCKYNSRILRKVRRRVIARASCDYRNALHFTVVQPAVFHFTVLYEIGNSCSGYPFFCSTDRPNVPPWERGRGGARGGRGGRGGFGFGALEEGPPSLFGGGTGPFGAGPDMPFGGGPVGFEAPPEGSGPFGNFRGNDEPSKPFLRRQEENRDQWRKDRKGGFASGEKKDEREGEENPKRQKREQEEDVAGEEAENPPEPKQEEGAEKDAFPEQPPYGALPPAPGNPQEGAGDSEPFSGAETETKSVAAIVGSMYDDDEDDEEEADGQSGRPEFVDEAQSHDNVRATAVEQGQELGQREIPPEDKTDTAEKAAWQLREEMPPQGVSSYSKDESPQDRTDELASESDSARESGLHANQRPLEEQHHPPEVDQEPNIQEAYSPGSQTKNDDASKDCPDHDDRGHHEES